VPLYGGDTDRGEGSSVFSVDNSAQPSVVANSTGITINNSGGAETRPRNVALLGCVKT
jgi:hypothetical protein